MHDTREFIKQYPDFCRRVLLNYINSPSSRISTKYIDIYLDVFDLYFDHQKSVKEISDDLKLTWKNTNRFKNNIMQIIDREINYSEDNTNDSEMLKIDIDNIIINLDDIIDQKIIYNNLLMIIKNYLTEKEQYVIIRRLGIYDGHEYTLNEIGIEMNLCSETVRRIEMKAFRKIRYYFYKEYKLGQRYWSNFYDYKMEEWYNKQHEKAN